MNNDRDRDFFDEVTSSAAGHFRQMMHDFIGLPMTIPNRMMEDHRQWMGPGSGTARVESAAAPNAGWSSDPYEIPVRHVRRQHRNGHRPTYPAHSNGDWQQARSDRVDSVWDQFDKDFQLNVSELDMYKSFGAQTYEGREGGSRKLVDTSTSRSTRTLADGSSTTKITTKKTYADGSTETFEDEHRSTPSYSQSHRIQPARQGQIEELPDSHDEDLYVVSNPNEQPRVEEAEQGETERKRWFWK